MDDILNILIIVVAFIVSSVIENKKKKAKRARELEASEEFGSTVSENEREDPYADIDDSDDFETIYEEIETETELETDVDTEIFPESAKYDELETQFADYEKKSFDGIDDKSYNEAGDTARSKDDLSAQTSVNEGYSSLFEELDKNRFSTPSQQERVAAFSETGSISSEFDININKEETEDYDNEAEDFNFNLKHAIIQSEILNRPTY